MACKTDCIKIRGCVRIGSCRCNSYRLVRSGAKGLSDRRLLRAWSGSSGEAEKGLHHFAAPRPLPRQFSSISIVRKSVGAQCDRVHVQTSPLSSLNSSLTLEPLMVLLMSSEATQPSAASGCQALVPTSYVDAIGK